MCFKTGEKLLWAAVLFAGLNLISLLHSDLPEFAVGIRNWIDTGSSHLEIPSFLLQITFWGLGLALPARVLARLRQRPEPTEEPAS